MIRSMLFLPGNAPNMIVNGGALRADAVILDLEDSVAPAEKDAARILVRNALKTVNFGCETVVRINSLDSGREMRYNNTVNLFRVRAEAPGGKYEKGSDLPCGAVASGTAPCGLLQEYGYRRR